MRAHRIVDGDVDAFLQEVVDDRLAHLADADESDAHDCLRAKPHRIRKLRGYGVSSSYPVSVTRTVSPIRAAKLGGTMMPPSIPSTMPARNGVRTPRFSSGASTSEQPMLRPIR